MEDILLPGKKLTGHTIDPNDPLVKKILRANERAIRALERAKIIDWEKLAHTYITI